MAHYHLPKVRNPLPPCQTCGTPTANFVSKVCEPCKSKALAPLEDGDDLALDARIDSWNDGAVDGSRGRTKASTCPHYLEGYAEGAESRKVRPVMAPRPEGYYHAPVGTFD